MKRVYGAAIDLGATSGRVILGTWDGRQLVLREVHRFPNAFCTLTGHDYWDIGGLWRHVQTGLAAAVDALPRGAKLASVGVDTWGVDHVLLNAGGRLVFPVHAYRDARTQPGLEALARDRRALARLYAATGIPNIFYNTSLQLAEAVTAVPELRRSVHRCLCLPDYFNFLLSGRMENEVSIASTTQFLSVAPTPAWSRTALRYFGVPERWFTPPIPGQTRLGPVRDMADLAGAVAVAVPGHDTACAFDAMPAAPGGGDLFISAGTWSLVGFESDEPVLGEEALAAGISNERTGTGGYRPLKNVPGLWLLEGVLKDLPRARPMTPRGKPCSPPRQRCPRRLTCSMSMIRRWSIRPRCARRSTGSSGCGSCPSRPNSPDTCGWCAPRSDTVTPPCSDNSKTCRGARFRVS